MSLVMSTRPTRAVAERIVTLGIEGVGPLDSALDLAEDLLREFEGDQEQVVEQLIRGEYRLGFVGGFATGMGGVATLPIMLPSAIAISWILQARLAAAIAIVYECDPVDPDIREKILLAITGDDPDDDSNGLIDWVSLRSLQQLPGALLNSATELAKKRLVRRVARSGVKFLSPRLLPVLSGVMSGRIDAQACAETGRRAVELFKA